MALPKDELELISKKLMFALDYTRFRSVCKSWRSAAPKRPQLPWFISYHQPRFSSKASTDSDENTIFVNFCHFSFETNKITRIRELSDWPLVSSFIDKSTVCIGSSRGWLALINSRTSSASIFNPLTNSTINLPNLQNNVAFTYDISSFILTSNPVESLSDCFALIYGFNMISYCKVGSNGWIELMPHPEINMYYSDIHICCYQGKLFIASLGDVFLCDFSQNHSVCKIVSVDSNDTGMDDFKLVRSYLVESDGDLLLVLFYLTDYDDDRDDDRYFRVFKLDFERQLIKVAELKSLGEKALFLTQKIAFSLTASKYPGCKENSIYYFLITYSVKLCIHQTLVVFDFERLSSVRMKGNISPIIEDLDTMNCDNCAWFQPSLLI